MARAAWRLKLRKVALQCSELALEGNIVSKVLKVGFFYYFHFLLCTVLMTHLTVCEMPVRSCLWV
jgi:hypothetical protein